jgi:hypothetical protein
MGFNADNIFVKAADRDELLGSVNSAFQEKQWKVAISDPLDGWVQIIESHEKTPPEFARKLSAKLKCVAVCAQLYEVSGEISWSVFESGIELEAVYKETSRDPSGEIKDFLLRKGIPFEMRLFREAIVQKQGWTH